MVRINHPTASAVETCVITLHAAASDPLVSAAADIDYRGTFEVTVFSRSPYRVAVAFDGFLDEFPAFECYAALGVFKKPLFRIAPPAGNTVTELPGGATRPVVGHVVFP
jgi:hypothetical protein